MFRNKCHERSFLTPPVRFTAMPRIAHGLFKDTFSSSEYTVTKLLFDVHKSVHRDTIMKVTNKMKLYRLIYYS